jgi:glucuronate isomerase
MEISNLTNKKNFLDDDYFLESRYSKILYHDYAKHLPIIDYHNHLSPKDVSENRIFKNLTQIWLEGDHYKWRAMRTLGIGEEFITGNAADEQKFEKWAFTVPYTLRNPLYHWTHLELKRYYGIDELLDPKSSGKIYHLASELTASDDFSTQKLLKKMNVEVICTTDDPVDDLSYHQNFAGSGNTFDMFPAFRPDKSFAIENGKEYLRYIEKLGSAAGVNIDTFDDLLQALKNRVEYFHINNGRLADHGLEQLYHFPNDTYDPAAIFNKVKQGQVLTIKEVRFFKFRTLLELAKMYHAKGWTQQFHLGALRNNNSRKLNTLGPDTGFDSIGDFSQASALAAFLNDLDLNNQLAKTVIYNLNPGDNEVFATMTGNFNDGNTKGKIQFGSGWWFLDQKNGMEDQMNTLSNMGLISCFVGMLTDSRSFLSFPRHEYFRRILCNLFGRDMEKGELPQDEEWIGKIISDICYYNAANYFNFPTHTKS